MPIEDDVIHGCAARGVTLSVAESCTGGLIGSLLVDIPGSSKVFSGGIIAYHNRPKQQLLGVPSEMLQHGGSVSEPAVKAMAEGARRAFGTTLALGSSGIAGPTGGSPEKPIGTVYVALAAPESTQVERFLFPSARRAYKLQVAEAALELVIAWLAGSQASG
jgi:PncC family amidohydrolase